MSSHFLPGSTKVLERLKNKCLSDKGAIESAMATVEIEMR